MIGIEQARELLGAASADEVGALLTLGILPGYVGGPDWAVDHSPFVVLLMK